MQNVEHIRKELNRLAKMARLMQLRELVRFIDLAGEVATEVHAGMALKPNVVKQA